MLPKMFRTLISVTKENTAVVYFDERRGDSHDSHWSKSSLSEFSMVFTYFYVFQLRN